MANGLESSSTSPERVIVWSELNMTAAFYLFILEAVLAPSPWRPELQDEPLGFLRFL